MPGSMRNTCKWPTKWRNVSDVPRIPFSTVVSHGCGSCCHHGQLSQAERIAP